MKECVVKNIERRASRVERDVDGWIGAKAILSGSETVFASFEWLPANC